MFDDQNTLGILIDRPGWSEECTDQDGNALRSQVLACLLEVVSAFHIGRGGTSMSFMGKGVTRAATLCLRHLVYEMATLSQNQVHVVRYCHDRAVLLYKT